MKTAAKWAGISFDEYRARVASGVHHCTRCKLWKSRKDFGNDRSRPDGRDRTCFQCRRAVFPCTHQLFRLGEPSRFKGRKHSEEAKARMSAAKKGLQLRLGKKHTLETRAKISITTRERTPRGAAHPSWKGGALSLNLSLRRQPEYFVWRKTVFARDGYRCRDCGDDRGGNLCAHHEKPMAKFPELAHDVDNGVTLCHPCHELRHFKPNSTRNLRKRKRGERLWR